MNKFTKQVLTGIAALGLIVPLATSTLGNSSLVSARSYTSTYVLRTKRGVWGYSKWNGKANGYGGRLYHRVYIKSNTKLYGEHDANRIGFDHFLSAYRTNHYTKYAYIPKSAFKSVRHHRRTVKHHRRNKRSHRRVRRHLRRNKRSYRRSHRHSRKSRK